MPTRLLSLALVAAALAACGGRPGTIEDRTAAAVSSLSPSSGSGNAGIHDAIRATFTRPLDPGSVTQASVLLSGPGGVALNKLLDLSADGTVLTVTPVAAPVPPTTFTVTFTGAVRDRLGNPVALPAGGWSFGYPEWLELGAGLVDAGDGGRGPQLALAPDGTPWVAWNEYGNRPGPTGTVSVSEIRVARWNGVAWARAGGYLNLDPVKGASRPALCLEGSGGAPVVIWNESSGSTGASALYARRWDGIAWQALGGTMNFDPGQDVFHRLLSCGASAPPTAAWEETLAAGGEHVYAKRWTGLSWDLVGPGPITSDLEAASQPNLYSMALDDQARPWASLRLVDDVRVKRFDGSAWVQAGGVFPGAGAGWVGARGGSVAVLVESPTTCGGAACDALVAWVWNGAGWDSAGTVATEPSPGFFNFAAIGIDPSGQLVAAFVRRRAAVDVLEVYRQASGGFAPVGGPVMTGTGFLYDPTLAFDAAGVPQVAAGDYEGAFDQSRVFRENR